MAILKKLFSVLGFLLIFVFFIFSTKAVGGNVGSSSPLLNGPFDGNLGAFELSHERSSYATLISLDETHKVEFENIKLADASTPDAGYYEGKIYSFFPPGIALAAWPLYILGKHYDLSLFFAYMVIPIFGIFALAVLYRIAREVFKFPVWICWFVVINTAIGCTFLNFIITFYQHVPTVFLMLLGFYSAYKYRYSQTSGFWWAALAWACYGLGPLFDFPNLILMLPIVAYLVLSGFKFQTLENSFSFSIKNTFLLSALVIMLFGGAQIYYNYSNFHSWKRFTNTLAEYDPTHPNSTLEALQAQDTPAIAAQKEQVAFSFREKNLVNGLYVMLIDPDKSLLMHMPMFLLAILGVWALRKRLSLEHTALLAVALTNIFLYSSFNDPWGGWGYGPRYLVISMPIISLFTGVWMSKGGFLGFKKIITFVFYCFGSLVALLGVAGKNYLVPKIYPHYPGLPFKFLSEFSFIKIGRNGTFIYNTYLANKLTLMEYFYILLAIAVLAGIFTLFILPLFNHEEILDT